MARVTKDTMIGDLLQIDQKRGTITFKYRHALSRMPIITDGDNRRGCYGSRT